MKKNAVSLWMTVVIAVIVALHIANAVYQGKVLPNCTRTYCEGMNAMYLQFEHPINRSSGYSPLYEFKAYLAQKLVGKDWSSLCFLLNTPFLIILLISLFLLGRELRDRETGLAAAMIVSVYPLVAGAYNRYNMEFPLLAFVVLFIYFLHKSDYFEGVAYSILAGLTLVIGVFTKEPFAAFAAGPVAYVIVLAFRDVVHGRFRRLLMTGGILSVVCLAAVAYFGFRLFLYLFWGRILYEPSGHAWYSFDNLRLFWIGLGENQLTLPFVIALVCGVFFFVREKDKRLVIAILLSVLVSKAFVLFMPHWKTERYLIPLLPLLALITASGIRRLLDRDEGRVVVFSLIAVGVFQVFDFTYDVVGLSRLRIGNLSYWNPGDIVLSVPYRQAQIQQSVKISELLLQQIRETEQREKSGKTAYRVTFLHGDWTLESYTMRSFFLLNSEKQMEEVQKCKVALALASNKGYQAKADYIVQLLPEDAVRAPLCGIYMDELKTALAKHWHEYPYFTMPSDWDALERKSLDYAREYEDLGLAGTSNGYDIYLYRNTKCLARREA